MIHVLPNTDLNPYNFDDKININCSSPSILIMNEYNECDNNLLNFNKFEYCPSNGDEIIANYCHFEVILKEYGSLKEWRNWLIWIIFWILHIIAFLYYQTLCYQCYQNISDYNKDIQQKYVYQWCPFFILDILFIYIELHLIHSIYKYILQILLHFILYLFTNKKCNENHIEFLYGNGYRDINPFKVYENNICNNNVMDKYNDFKHECCICLAPLNVYGDIMLLFCGHRFHLQCIKFYNDINGNTWFPDHKYKKYVTNCPICKQYYEPNTMSWSIHRNYHQNSNKIKDSFLLLPID